MEDSHGLTKKLFTAPKRGTLSSTKEELGAHIKEIYSDPHSNQSLLPLNGLKHLLEPDIKFQIGNIREKEVNDFVIKKTETRVPQEVKKSRINYKVYPLS